MLFRQIADPKLAQYAYLIGCQRTKQALVVDPERDIDRYLAAAAEEGLTVTHVAETHIHADFLSGARDLADATGAHLYLSAEGEDDGWGSLWAQGRDDVTFLHDGDSFEVGNIEVRAVHSPGHTPEHLSYLVVDHGGGADTPMGLVSGDFVFVGDLGRPDLLESAAGRAARRSPPRGPSTSRPSGSSPSKTSSRCGRATAPGAPAARRSAPSRSRRSGTRRSTTGRSTPRGAARRRSSRPSSMPSPSRRSTSAG